MEILWIMGFFFILCTMLFLAIAFFFPEWVGITGKKAHEINKSHQEETESKDI